MKRQSKTRNLLQRLRDRENDVLTFAFDLRVPFTSNQAESDLRMSKTKIKVSGAIRTLREAERFAHIRGYISSARKNDTDALRAILGVFTGNPRQPSLIHAT
jgi:transposase